MTYGIYKPKTFLLLSCKKDGKFEECADFEEVEGEAWMTKKI